MIEQLFSVCLCGVLHVLQVLYEVISAFCARYDWLIGGVLRGRYLVLFCCYVLCFLSKNLFTHSHCVGCGFRACFGVLFVDFTMLSLAVCCFVEQRTILPVWHVFVVVLILLCGALFHFIHMLTVFACLWSFPLDLSLVFTLFGLLCHCIVILQMFRVWLTYHRDCFSACFLLLIGTLVCWGVSPRLQCFFNVWFMCFWHSDMFTQHDQLLVTCTWPAMWFLLPDFMHSFYIARTLGHTFELVHYQCSDTLVDPSVHIIIHHTYWLFMYDFGQIRVFRLEIEWIYDFKT